MSVQIPPILTLPVSRGGDLIVDFMQILDGVYTDYDPGISVRLEVDIVRKGGSGRISATVIGPGTISGFHAVCRIESIIADTITDGSLWRAVISYPTVPNTTEIVEMNGDLKRYDGLPY